jgi:hypothetical protein
MTIYSTIEISELLGVSVLRIRQIAFSRNIPYAKKCGRIKFYAKKTLPMFALAPSGRPKSKTASKNY